MNALKTKNLDKHFDGVKAVDNLSVGIQKGLITGIVGPNGSGKTTLINTLSGMLRMDGGAVEISDVKLSRIKPHHVPSYGITRTFQNVRLFEQMTVLDNILVVLTERNLVSAFFEKHNDFHLKKAEATLRHVGLWEKRNQLASNLSYGQRKLLEIARAMVMDTDIYLFDEPFAGLFPEMVKIVSTTLKQLRTENKTVILVEHDMSIIRELCDHVIVMDAGKLLTEGNPEKVLNQKEVIEAYLGE
ncbi:MAG: ABC transporter ATP-binding protein [Candidatus Buchananbacteria bacterium CG10_big_fil_rev_8_21_14_0_10_42_9]|uniref:ABC transporter ATP-binding protein n=1 Tax=Candidatus Buchananbacteria bacterium CG10_big_fil_rev_8_21_14_0_10_42_9 TaxID=1974526 RepID=A0A2H0W0L3_9BACT|nr:MAG: ABC transporter ATP-binding protein [Candidatus Buchananbacteria bacterium CG10_big_fil_rev_8_21_14_0_10_42_9]